MFGLMAQESDSDLARLTAVLSVAVGDKPAAASVTARFGSVFQAEEPGGRTTDDEADGVGVASGVLASFGHSHAPSTVIV